MPDRFGMANGITTPHLKAVRRAKAFSQRELACGAPRDDSGLNPESEWLQAGVLLGLRRRSTDAERASRRNLSAYVMRSLLNYPDDDQNDRDDEPDETPETPLDEPPPLPVQDPPPEPEAPYVNLKTLPYHRCPPW